ncbi:aldehyde ferredoxin oxidoreductase family protein [Chloroflexota bacterium]
MSKFPGYNGQILRVDLTRQQITEEELDQETARKYFGGTGLGISILYKEVPPGVQWSDPENRIIFASGPLGGTRVMGSGNFTVVTKGAMTEGPTATQANGYFGAFLRFAGFDAIIIQGKAKELTYLFISDGKAELKDASSLSGKDTWETEESIKAELGYSPGAMSVFGIGPAGEKLVRFAAIIGDRGHAAGHNGSGAVMGSKNLKAIAISRGKGRVVVHDDAKLSATSKEMLEAIKNNKGWSNSYRFGTLALMGSAAVTGGAPFRNYGTTVLPMTKEQLNTFSPEYLRKNLKLVQRHPCWGCQMHHCDLIEIPEGPLAGKVGEEPEYEGFTGMGTQVGIFNGLTVTALANEVDRLGLDINEAGWTVGMVMECYEKGLLSRKDTDGIEMTWGNVDAVRAIINKIARREGIGDLLADGAMRAAQRFGATEMAIYGNRRGNTPVGLDHRRNWAMLLDSVVSNTGTNELHLMPNAISLGLPELSGQFAHQEIAARVANVKGITPLIDCLGVCRQSNREIPALLTAMVNASTGWNVTWEEMVKVGFRAVNLLRCFYIRRGYTPDAETPSPRYGSTIPDGPNQGKNFMAVLDDMLNIYYREMGWDRASGKPLPDTLTSLGLEYTIPDIWTS